jgi:general secretion pathway protein H
MKPKDAEDGFSLVEMLVVLAIISLIGFIGFSGFTGNKKTQSLSTIARDIQNLAALTSLHAVSTGTTASLIVDVSNRVVSTEYNQNLIQLPPAFKLNLLTGAELLRQDDTASINFYNDGTSTGGEITIEDSNGSKQTIRIFWLTGAIEITGGPKL